MDIEFCLFNIGPELLLVFKDINKLTQNKNQLDDTYFLLYLW